MKRKINSKVAQVCVRFLPFICISVISAGCNERRQSDRFIIPAGYVGWVCVQYYVAGSPLLPTNGTHNLIYVPFSGYLKTSSIPQSGEARDEYLYTKGNNLWCIDNCGNKSGMIWGRRLGAISGQRKGDELIVSGNPDKLYFFVGTEQQYKKYGTYSSSSPPIGSIQ